MKSSSRFVVALHVLTGLAVLYLRKKESQAVSSQNMAWSVNTNPVVIRRLLVLLKRAGLVETETGAGGGSRIARPPDKITLYEIYDAVEGGSVFHYHYNAPNPECPVGANIQNVLQDSLEGAETALRRELESTSLADIARRIMARIDRQEAISA